MNKDKRDSRQKSILQIIILSFFALLVGCKPVASSKQYDMLANTSLYISLEATNAPTAYSIVTPPNHGQLSGLPPNLSYKPHDGFVGADSFTFTASNSDGTSAPGTISISVLPGVTINSFSAAKQSIFLGDHAVLQWNVQNAENVTISPIVGDVPLTGSVEVSPTIDTEYTLTARGALDTKTLSLRITVVDAPTIGSTPPFLQKPLGLTQSNEPEFSWRQIKNASQYVIEVWDDSANASVYSGTVIAPPFLLANPLDISHRYKWRIRARNDLTEGEPSAWAAFSMNEFDGERLLEINEPLNGAEENSLSVTVSGTYFVDDGAVFVNDSESCTFNGRFYINNVTLPNTSSNTLKSTLQRVGTSTVTKAVSVNFSGALNPWTLKIDNDCGDAPLTTAFSLSEMSPIPKKISLDIGSNGSIEYTKEEAPFSFSHTFAQPGVYPVHVEYTTQDGRLFSHRYYVIAKPPGTSEYTENLYYQRSWSAFTVALKESNTELMLPFFSEQAKITYGPILDDISDQFFGESEITPLEPFQKSTNYRSFIFLHKDANSINAYTLVFSNGKIVSL